MIEEEFDFCKVCGWQEDYIQKDKPNSDVGANPISLNEAKAKWSIGESVFENYPHPNQING
jgi:hypothetical protein